MPISVVHSNIVWYRIQVHYGKLCYRRGLIYLLTYLITYLFTYLLTYVLTYLLTPWSIVLLEKLTDSQLVKKFSAFYGIRKIITAFTSFRHLSLSLARRDLIGNNIYCIFIGLIVKRGLYYSTPFLYVLVSSI